MTKKPIKSRNNLSVYSNLAHKRKTKKDAATRRKAEYLASLPKQPLKRLLYRLHPKRVAGYWFSKKGAFMALKITGIAILLMVLLVGAAFAYFRKDLDTIRPGELAKRVQTTVSKYTDRNDVPLWEDKGDGDYKLVVDGKDINEYMKQATVAIEDKDFYKHSGVSPTGIARSLINNANGGNVQGGSTLTQQLVKQVFFPPDEALKRGLDGVPRKIKEIILSIEVERMYNKEQILDLYLNESPYGGRRNGVESAAQAYFHKSSKDLTIPEAALLAAIPNQPGLYNPYKVEGHEALISRQHKVLDGMVELGYITQAQSDEAKKYPIIDSIQPVADQDMKAPHFVQMVKGQLETELGRATVGRGGLTIKTTLDIRIQGSLEEEMAKMFNSNTDELNGFSNGAATVEDNATGQIIAMLGSRSFDYPGFGQDDAASNAFIQPGSSIKPLVYAQLFAQKPSGQPNYGSGSILKDEATDFGGGYKPKNATDNFLGNINIRQSLALSRNIPVIKAMAVAGIQPTWQTIRDAGDKEYCTQGADAQAGLSSAIGGCGTKQIDHVNAYATLARGGVYKPHTSILEVKNNQGETLKQWKDESKQVIDPQVTYILSDILHDANARRGLTTSTQGFSYGNTGIKTATKTGTSDIGGNKSKDLWVMSYSPAISMGVWLGNPDTKPLTKRANSLVPTPIIDKVMRFAHLEVYGKEGRWKPNDWFTQPAGIQKINNELYPSWYNKSQGQSNAKMAFDKVSKKKATNCTPDGAKIEVDIVKSTDPFTKKEVITAPDGYDGTKDDDIHKCDDAKPSVGSITLTKNSGMTYKISASAVLGTHPLQQLEIRVGSTVVATLPITASGTYSTEYTFTSSSQQTVMAIITDSAYYSSTTTQSFTPDS